MNTKIFLIAVLAISLAACNNSPKTKNNGNTTELSNGVTKLQNDEKASFDYRMLSTEWAELSYTGEDGKYVVCEGNEKALTIEGSQFVYWNNRYDILKSYKTADTIVINAKLSNQGERDFKFFWLDKDKGIAQWTLDDESLGDSGLFVTKEKLSKFSIVKCWGDEKNE